MVTNNQVAGAPTVPLNMEVVRRESAILEEILKPDLHEYIMKQVCIFNQSPFRVLSDYVLKGITPELFAHYKKNVAMLGNDTAAYLSPGIVQEEHPGTDRLLSDIVSDWNPAEGIQ